MGRFHIFFFFLGGGGGGGRGGSTHIFWPVLPESPPSLKSLAQRGWTHALFPARTKFEIFGCFVPMTGVGVHQILTDLTVNTSDQNK